MSGASQTGFDFGTHPHDKVRREPWMPADARRAAHAKPTQRDRLRSFLESRVGEWVPLPQILELRPRIAQYNARIYELRIEGGKEGFAIDCKTETSADGETLSWYRLRRVKSA